MDLSPWPQDGCSCSPPASERTQHESVVLGIADPEARLAWMGTAHDVGGTGGVETSRGLG